MLSMAYTIRIARFIADEPTIRDIRFKVFVDEQHVPPEIEMDDRDPHCVHLLAFTANQAIATARIDLEYDGKIGRLAVLPGWRQCGIGRALMDRCHAIAVDHGLDAVWCHAQVTAVPFYAKLGYETEGALFDEAGIQHCRMQRRIGDT